MISDTTLSRLKTRYQTTELNIRREYVQHLFLSYFYQQPQTGNIMFKGGTALRIIYKSPRFSEDLDFDSTLHDLGEIEHAVLKTLDAIEYEGIGGELHESKDTSGGYLARIDFKLGSSTVPLQIEISFRQTDLRSEFESISGDFMPTYTMYALAQEQLVQGKIAALLDRQKPRDFYDLYFMLQNGLTSPGQRAVLQNALALVRATKINFNNELKLFLPQSQWAIIRDFKAVLERAISRFV